MVCHGIENHYLSLFDSRGNFGRSYRLRGNVEEAGFGAAAFADVLPDRSIIAGKSVRTEDYPPRTSAFARAERDYLILAADGSVRADLGRHPGREDYWYRGAFGFMLQSPFGRLAVSAAWGELAVVGTATIATRSGRTTSAGRWSESCGATTTCDIRLKGNSVHTSSGATWPI